MSACPMEPPVNQHPCHRAIGRRATDVIWLFQSGLLLLGALACQPPAPEPPVPPTPLVCPSDPAPGIRIMTYNAFLNVDAPGHPSSEDAYMTPTQPFGEGGQAQRARVIAQLILEDPPDVIIFNEANDDEARDALVDELGGVYIARVLELDEHDTDNDSGLMLFSRHPFTGLDHAFEPPDDDFFIAFNQFQPFDLNWWVFPGEMTNGGDDWMNRGVALVRMANVCDNNRPFSIAFTHTQSSSPEDKFCEWGQDVQDRNEQMRHIRELIEFSLNADRRLVEPIFVVGDLNIEGNQVGANIVSTQNRGAYLSGDGDPCIGPKLFNEWQLNFDSRSPAGSIADDESNGFFSCRGNQAVTRPCSYDGRKGTFMVDSWAYETSAEDPGQTNSGQDTGGPLVFTGPNDGERLDYILHNRPVDRETRADLLCMQHIRRGFPTAGAVAYSDHLPLSADFNRPAPRCSVRPRQSGDPELLDGDDANPLGPQQVFFDIEDPSAADYKEIVYSAASDSDTGITFPGSVQWYVIDQPYPYRIRVEPAGAPQATVAYEVYQARDLSNREGAYEGECIPGDRSQECLYLMSDPPYYIKVFAANSANPDKPNRAQTGGYAITFRRYDCSSPEEACPLEPGLRSPPFLWPAGQQLDPTAATDTMWFRFEHRFPNGQPYAPVLAALHDIADQQSINDQPIDFFTLGFARKNGNALSAVPTDTPPAPDWESVAPAGESPEPIWRRESVVADGALPGLKGGVPETYLFKVTRDSNYNDQQSHTWAELLTELTYFRPTFLYCFQERTWVGNDDIAARFKFGDASRFLQQVGDVNGDFETWDEKSQMGAYGDPMVPGLTRSNWPAKFDGTLGPGESLWPDLIEDYIDGDNFEMRPLKSPIPGLEADELGETKDKLSKHIWSDRIIPADADYRYEMHFMRSHRSFSPRGPDDCGPERTYVDLDTGEFFCACLNDLACNVTEDGNPTNQVCNTNTLRCEYP